MPGRLRVRRPSPTTVSFAVSNASRRASSPAKLLFGLQILIRALLFCCVIIVGLVRLRHISLEPVGIVVPWQAVWATPLGSQLCDLVDPYNPWAIAAVCTVVLYGVFRRGYTEESLLVIRGFGIQTSTSSSTYLSSAATRFIPTTQIQDIVIHEAFRGFEVRFYLAVIVEGEPNVLVVFPVGDFLRSRYDPANRASNYSIYYRSEKSLKKCGVGLDAVFTMLNHDLLRAWTMFEK